jgi:hypothetical protein
VNPQVLGRSGEVLPSVVRLGGIVERDGLMRVQHLQTRPLTRLILRVVKPDQPLIGGSDGGYILVVPRADRGGIEAERVDGGLQDQVQRPVQPHLGGVQRFLTHWCVGHDPGAAFGTRHPSRTSIAASGHPRLRRATRPVASPRDSISSLTRLRSLGTCCFRTPSMSPACWAAPCGST